jgi:hypothetical protein
MNIPVEVQRPNAPHTKRYVGEASDRLSVKRVADLVGVPAESFLEGKIIKHKGERRWSIIADVIFGN